MQAILKRCIFFSSLGKKLRAICSLLLVRKLVRVPLPLLWFGTSTTNIQKIVKSANGNLTQDKHQNYNLLRQHAIDWLLLEEILMNRGTVIFLLQHLGFVINWKKSVLTPVQEIAFLGLTINSVHSRTFFKQNKNSESSFRMSEIVKQSTNITSGVDKVGLLTSTIQAVLPARLNCGFLILIRKPFLFRQNCFERKLKNRTEMVGTELRTAQWPDVNSTTWSGVNTDRCLNNSTKG